MQLNKHGRFTTEKTSVLTHSTIDASTPRVPSYHHPGLHFIAQHIQHNPKAKVLDLGPPSAASFNFYKKHYGAVRFENLNEWLCEFINNNALHTKADFMAALGGYLSLKPSEKFDVILSWDLLCFLDNDTLSYFAEYLAQHCQPNALLQMVRYWGGLYPSMPCKFQIITEGSASNSIGATPMRHAQKLTPVSQLEKHMPAFKLAQHFVENKDMCPAITEAVFQLTEPAKPLPAKVGAPVLPAVAGNNSLRVTQHGVNHKSAAIAQLLGGVGHVSPVLSVLDLGAYHANNASFYAQQGRSAFFVNVPSLVQPQNAGATHALPCLLPMRPNAVFDVIMGWDILCTYSQAQVAKIMQLLQPHCHKNTRMHLLHYTGLDSHLSISHYDITLAKLQFAHSLPTAPLPRSPKITHKNGVDGSGFRYTIGALMGAMGAGVIEHNFLYQPGMHHQVAEYIVQF